MSISHLFLLYSYYVNISPFHTKHLLFLFFFWYMCTITKLLSTFRGDYTMNNTAAISADMLIELACKQQSSDIQFYPDPIHDETKIYYRILGKRKYIKTIKQA